MNLRSWLLLIGLSSCWGSSFLMIEIALEDFSPAMIAFLRIFIGTILLWGIVWWKGIEIPKNLRLAFGMLCAGLFVTSLPFTLISWGQQQVDSSLAAILNATTAIFGVVFASILFRDEKMNKAKACGVLVGFAGVIVTVGIHSLRQLDINSIAQYAILVAAISYAVGGASAKVFMKIGSPVLHAAGMTSVGALLLLPIVIAQQLQVATETGTTMSMVANATTIEAMTIDISLKAWVAIIWLGVVSTAIAYLFYYNLLRAAGVTNLLLCTLIIPPIAIFLGVIFLDEVLTARLWGGFILIAFGLLLIDGRILLLLKKR